MTPKPRHKPLLSILPAALAVGCAAAPGSRSDGVPGSQNTRDQVPRLIIQVCTPKDFSLAGLDTIARGNRVGSVSSYLPRKVAQTGLDQSVHETYSALPDELIANVVRLKDSDLQFVFLPTQFSPASSWTAWLSPHHASADRAVALREVQGRKYAVVPTPENAPKLRYRLMPFSDYLARVGARREGAAEESVGPC